MKQFAKLVPIVKNPAAVKAAKDLDIDEAVKLLVKGLEQSRDQGSFAVHVSGESEAPVRLDLKAGKTTVSREATGSEDFAIKASRATLAQIAKGDLSPVDAYLAGKMEVHGDLSFGKRLFARLAARSGEKEF